MATTTSYSDSEHVFIEGRVARAKTPRRAIMGERKPSRKKNVQPTRVSDPDTDRYQQYAYAPWGDDNNYPANIRSKGQMNDVISSGIDMKARMLAAGGVTYGIEVSQGEGEKKKKVFEPLDIPEIEDWIAENRVNDLYIPRATLNFYWYNILFPEFVLSKNRKRINRVQIIDTEFCRWRRQNKYGYINGCYLSPHWLNSGINPDTGEREVQAVAALDAMATVRDIQRGSYYKYIYPSYYPSMGRIYYPRPIWTSAFDSKWYDVAMAIPESKQAMMQNQIAPKFLIYFHEEYWKTKYANWDRLKDEDRIQKMEEKRQEIEETLTAPGNYGKTISSNMVSRNPNHPDKTMKLIEIEPIQDPIKDGVNLEDDREATWHLMTAVGINGAMLGSIPGTDGAMGGNSGSNTNASTNQQLAFITSHANIVLSMLNLAARYNGWKIGGRQVVWQFNDLKMKLQNQLAPEERGI